MVAIEQDIVARSLDFLLYHCINIVIRFAQFRVVALRKNAPLMELNELHLSAIYTWFRIVFS